MKTTLIILSILLYLVGIAGKAYADTPIGFHVKFNFRHGPFFGLIFFVSGYLLQRHASKTAWLLLGCLLTIFGLIAHFCELVILNKYWGISMNQEFVIGTYFFGTGVALIGLSNWKSIDFKSIKFIGPITLGIYAIHFIFVDLFQPLSVWYGGSVAWEIGYPALVFVFSASSAYLMSKAHCTKGLVL